MPHVWISLTQDEDGYPPYTQEQLPTREVGPDLHEVLAVPVFAKGIAVGDVLATQSVGDEIWATSVSDEGDRWCARVVGLGGFDEDRIVEIFESMGGTASITSYGVVTLDFGPQVDGEHVVNELRAGRDEGDWDFDVGVVPPS